MALNRRGFTNGIKFTPIQHNSDSNKENTQTITTRKRVDDKDRLRAQVNTLNHQVNKP